MNTFELRKYKSNVSKSKCLRAFVRSLYISGIVIHLFYVSIHDDLDNSVINQGEQTQGNILNH